MMKHFLAFAFMATLSIGMIGCGDDDNPVTDINQYLEFKTGDVFTFDYYDRDATNARIDGSKKIITWTVLRTGIDSLGQKGVSEIEEVRYEPDNTEISRTKVYLVANSLGQVMQYDLYSTVISRFADNIVDLQAVISQLPKPWIQISDTKSPSALTWSSVVSNKRLTNVSIPTINAEIDADINLNVNSSHLGESQVVVPSGTYASAFRTDHQVPIEIITAEEIMLPPPLSLTIASGTVLVNDSVALQYGVDIDGGILSHSLESKKSFLVPLGTSAEFDILGYEMELTNVVRATE